MWLQFLVKVLHIIYSCAVTASLLTFLLSTMMTFLELIMVAYAAAVSCKSFAHYLFIFSYSQSPSLPPLDNNGQEGPITPSEAYFLKRFIRCSVVSFRTNRTNQPISFCTKMTPNFHIAILLFQYALCDSTGEQSLMTQSHISVSLDSRSLSTINQV